MVKIFLKTLFDFEIKLNDESIDDLKEQLSLQIEF